MCLGWAVSGVETEYELSEAGECPFLLLSLFWIEEAARPHRAALLVSVVEVASRIG